MENDITIKIKFMPPEGIDNLKEFQKKFFEKYSGVEITKNI